MHNYPLRIKDILFERILIEAKFRGVSINEMIIELIERGLIIIIEEDKKCRINNSKEWKEM